MDREITSDQQGDNPFAYYETQGGEELPDEISVRDQLLNRLRLVEMKDITRNLAVMMILPSLLMSGLLIVALINVISVIDDHDPLLKFPDVALTVFIVGVPWLITIFATVGLFRGNLLAVNVGMIYSFLPTLLALASGLVIMHILAFIPFFICAVYSFEFVRVRIAISKVGYIHKREEPDL
jgi:hypothetical protein